MPPNPVRVGDTRVRAWFSPGYGSALAHKLAHAIGRAKRRIRIASPVITSGPILGTLAEVAADGRVDLAGVVDATQIDEVLRQWEANGHATWKIPALHRALTSAPFSGKRSTPYRPGSVHDYMHAKMVIADDVLFVGSYNLSHSGEMNAENVLEIEDAGLAERAAAFVDVVRARYPAVALGPQSSIVGHLRRAVEAAPQVESDTDVAGEEREVAATVLLAALLDLRQRVQPEGAGPLEPALVAR